MIGNIRKLHDQYGPLLRVYLGRYLEYLGAYILDLFLATERLLISHGVSFLDLLATITYLYAIQTVFKPSQKMESISQKRSIVHTRIWPS